MTIDRNTVLKTAKLARLNIAENKIELYTKELCNIMDVVDTLKSADIKDVEPLINVSEFDMEMRKDEVKDGNCAEKILKNSPKEKFEYFIVPKVIE